MRRIMQRLAWAVFVVWATVSLAFLITNALPADAARMIAGQQAPPAAVEKIRKTLGLDRPLSTQYGLFLRRLMHFGPSTVAPTDPVHGTCATLGPLHVDLGRSYQQRRAVTTILGERAPRTILLAFAAAIIQALIGITAGAIAALNRQRAIDRLTVGLSLLGISAPTFAIGLLLQWVFAYELRIFPIDGFGETVGEHLLSLVLPAVTLGVFGAAYYTRIVRDEMIGELSQDYVRTARAKGVSPFGVVARHVLRNALVPIITIFGLEVGTLIGGAIVTETVFRWPGIGSLSVDAMLDRDGPVMMGCVVITATAVVVSTLAVDLAYAFLDPRVRRTE
jgi:peptide/nickel transport system permease protein